MNSPKNRIVLISALLGVLALPVTQAIGATLTWDGNGDANASGDWTTPANWSGDTLPASADTATLGNVTSGTRTVTIASGETATAKNLAFTQSTAGASNILSIASGGTLDLGGGQTWAAASAGTARVDLGGTIDFTGYITAVTVNTDLTFTEAGSILRASSSSTNAPFTFGGAVNVNAGSGTAQIAYTGSTTTRTLTATFGAGSALNVNSGTLEFSTTVSNLGSTAVTVTTQGATSIASGAELKLSTPTSGSGSAGVAFANSGALTQAGKITTNGRGSSTANTLTNSGAWKVSGLSATIEKATNNSAQDPTFTNTAAGVFSGATANDLVTYNHLQTPGTDLAFANSGVIAAGNGTGGAGLSSVGTLTLANFAVTNAAGASLAFDLGGTGAGQFDVLALQSGSLSLENATLALTLANGFTPASSFSLQILTSDDPSSVTGSFVGLTVNGVSDSDYSFSYDNTTGIGTLTYTAAAIPEPSACAALLGLVCLGLACSRLRRG